MLDLSNYIKFKVEVIMMYELQATASGVGDNLLSRITPSSRSVFSSKTFNGSQICDRKGDPTGVYNHVVRYDSGIVTAENGAFEQYLRTDFDADIRKNDQEPRRTLSLGEDGGFSHSRTYQHGDLEIAVDTWGARQYQIVPNDTRFYNISVELRGPESVVADRRGSVEALLQSVSSLYGLKKVTSMFH